MQITTNIHPQKSLVDTIEQILYTQFTKNAGQHMKTYILKSLKAKKQ